MSKCLNCSKKSNTPLITESRVLSVISENMKYHIDKKITLYNSPLKKDIKKYISLVKEARKLYSRNLLTLNEVDSSIVNSNLGDQGDYNGEKVNLDLPIKGENPIDTLTLDIPLFIRMLEYAKEDAKSDVELHDVTEKAIALSQMGDVLNMDNYYDIVGKKVTESYEMYHRNPSTKQVTKHKFDIYEQEFNVDRVRKAIEEILTIKEDSPITSKPSLIKFLYNYTTDRFYETIVEYEDKEDDTLNWYQTNELLQKLEVTIDIPDHYNEVALDKILDELEYQNIKAVYDQSMSAPSDDEL